MRLPIPQQMRAVQQWGGTVPVPGDQGGQAVIVPIGRVQFPHEYERDWTVALAPIMPPDFVGNGDEIDENAPGPPCSSGIYAVITYGSVISQSRVIDWPWIGGQFPARGSVVQLDLRRSPLFQTGNLPRSVSGEIVDAPPPTTFAATCTDTRSRSLAAAAGSQSAQHIPPRGATAVRVQLGTGLLPTLTPPTGTISVQFMTTQQTSTPVQNLGSANETAWVSWSGTPQGSAMESLADTFAIRLVRTTASAFATPYRLQYRIDL